VSKLTKALVTCPRCGQQQLESRAAFSAACKACGQYLRVQELLKPVPKAAAPAPELRHIACFECAAEFDVPAGAHSTMCKKCSCYIDLLDYSIGNAVSKNFRTKGAFVIQPNGYVFNSETVASDASIKGKFIGKLVVERCLTLYSSAQIKGTLSAARLVVPSANLVRWDGEMHVGSAEIEGELTANLHAKQSVHVKPNGRLFGTLQAGSLVADLGAVLSVQARFGG
jgi:cytoskeletal protein CcmA (bactofilin family)